MIFSNFFYTDSWLPATVVKTFVHVSFFIFLSLNFYTSSEIMRFFSFILSNPPCSEDAADDGLVKGKKM